MSWLPALRHYAAAAASALTHYAPGDAAQLSTRALELLPRCRDGNDKLEVELALVSHRAVAYSQLYGVGGAEAKLDFERAREICDVLPPTSQRGLVLNGLGWVYHTRGVYAEAKALGERLHALSVDTSDPVLAVCACNLLGVTATVQGEHAVSRDWLVRGLTLCEEHGAQLPREGFFVEPAVSMRANLAIPLMHLGFPDQAQQHLDAAIAHADRLGTPMEQIVAWWFGATFEIRMGHFERAAQYAASLTQLVARTGIEQARGPSLWLSGLAAAYLGSPREGCEQIRQGLDAHHRLGMFGAQAEVLGFMVEALLLMGDWATARQRLDGAVLLAAHLKELAMKPYHLMLSGRIAKSAGESAAARDAWHEALEIARAQGSVWTQLRALVALCEETGPSPGPSHEDRAALATLHAQLTEGFGTELAQRAAKLLKS